MWNTLLLLKANLINGSMVSNLLIAQNIIKTRISSETIIRIYFKSSLSVRTTIAGNHENIVFLEMSKHYRTYLYILHDTAFRIGRCKNIFVNGEWSSQIFFTYNIQPDVALLSHVVATACLYIRNTKLNIYY